ncbi:hypothetical protein [Sphingomonas glacialis]|nr:hypothetical protein [Sphingomonas glacialis]
MTAAAISAGSPGASVKYAATFVEKGLIGPLKTRSNDRSCGKLTFAINL